MRLRALIEGEGPPADRPNPATLAIVATVEAPRRPSVATVATVADFPEPECWAGRLRELAGGGVRWDLAADALDSLMDSGAIERALILGWDARELVGVQRAQPHDSPARAGLVFSLRPGDAVGDVRDAGCIIASGNVRHIWRRIPLPSDSSICLPWELRL